MTKFVGESANYASVTTGILASGVMPTMQEGGIVDAFECTTFPSGSTEHPETIRIVVDGLASLRNAQGGYDVYNFEVEHYHTYVAGGIRVHNQSGILGRTVNKVEALIDNFAQNTLGANPGGFWDTVTDIASAPVHLFGAALTTVSSLAINAVNAIGTFIGNALSKLDAWLGRVDKRDSHRAAGVIQAGICDGDQLGTKPDVGRGVGVL